MRWPPRVPTHHPQQFPYRPVVRDRIWHRLNRLEPKASVGTTPHYCPPIGSLPISVLHVIKPLGVRFPDVDFHIGDWVTVHVFDSAKDEARGALGVVRNEFAGDHVRGFVRVKRAENGTFGGVVWFGVVDGVDEEGEAEDVGKEDEFLDLHEKMGLGNGG